MNTPNSPPPSSTRSLGQLVSTRHQPESTTRTTTTTTTTTRGQNRVVIPATTSIPLNPLDPSTEEDSSYAELEILPSTTTSVTTTTTILTTHFKPIKILKSRPIRPVSSHQQELRELLEREGEREGTSRRGGRELELDSRMYPLSGLEWNKVSGSGAGGIGNFRVELGDMEARFVHDTNEGGGRRASEGSSKGKGKERERGISGVPNSARGKPVTTTKGVGMEEVQDMGRRESQTLGVERERRNSTRVSPGPPPRKRPRSDSSHRGGGGGGDETMTGGGRRSSVNPHSLPSPNQSPPSPVPTSSGGEESQDTSLILEEEEQQGTKSPSGIELPGQQSFNFGSTPSLSALLSLPDLVDTFDQLSPSLQSYMIFTLLRRSSIPVLQTVANIIAPALRRDFLTDLPPELSVQILGYLDPKTLCRASLVCKSWRRLVDGEWRIWKKMMDFDGLWIGDGSEERDAREIVTGKKENWFLERWKAGVWEEKKTTTWNGKVEPDQVYIDGVTPQHARRPSISNSSVRLASPSSSRAPSPTLPEPEPHNVHPYKILYRRRWLTRRNWKRAEPRRTTFSSSTATTNVVTCLQFDEEKIVSASDDADHSIHVFDTQSGMERAELRGHEGGVWALQYIGNVLVSGSTDRTVRVWDLDSAKCTHEFIGHTSTVRCLQIVEPINVNPDSKGEPIWEPPYPLVVTGSRDWSLRVWKLPFAGKDREYHPAVPMSPTEGGTSEPTDNPFYERQLSGHRGAVRAVAASGRTVVSGSYDHKVRVWDLLTGECRHVLEGHSQKVYSVVIDPGRGRCASGSMDGTVKLWSLETGEILNSLDGHSSLVGLLGLSHRCLVSAAADWTLRIWNPETGECRHALNAHQGAITCFQHDEYKIVSGSDGTLKMWDTQTGEFVRDLLANLTGVWQVAFNQRYCVAAVQRNGSSEFELLDFGAVDQDEIKPVMEDEPTTTQPFQNPSPSANDDDDIDMPDSTVSVRLPSTTTPLATTSSTSSSSRNPPPLRGPSQIPRFRSNDSTTTPDNQTHSSTTRAVRHVDSRRNLGDRVESTMLRGSNDSPSVQGGGGGGVRSMDVDDEGVAEASTRVWSRRSEGGVGDDEESEGTGVEGEEGGNESFEVEEEED